MKTNRYLPAATAAILGAVGITSSFGFQAKLGDSPPDFSVTSMSGKQVFFKDMQTGGPLFIYFIRDGDSVSQQSTSYINRIIRTYGASRTTWYGFVNARLDRARAFQAESDPAFRLERDENLSATIGFGVTNSPTVLEYDGNGKLINIWKGFSAVNLKGINMAVAEASHKKLKDIDFTKAPSTVKFGVDFNSGTSSSRVSSGSGL